MKNIELLRRERLRVENERISHLLALYNDSATPGSTKSELLKRIDYSKLVIGNLNETINIMIAKHANLFMNGLIESLKYFEFNDLFFTDINAYLNRVANLRCENNLYIRNAESGYNLDMQRAVLFFNFTYGEILEIRRMTRDEFMTFINNKYGTNIPMLGELEEAKLKWSESCDDLEQVKNARELKLVGLRNGAFVQTEYPLFFERDVLEQYDQLENDAEKKLSLK